MARGRPIYSGRDLGSLSLWHLFRLGEALPEKTGGSWTGFSGFSAGKLGMGFLFVLGIIRFVGDRECQNQWIARCD